MFATCERHRALEFLQKQEPELNLTDSPESAGPLLDLVQADLIRVQDPAYHNPCQVVPGNNWDESRRSEVIAVWTAIKKGAQP